VDPVSDPLLLRISGSSGNRTRTSGSVARNPDHYTTEETVSSFGEDIRKDTIQSQSQSQSHVTTDSLRVKFTLELVTRYYLLSESCCVVSVLRPLSREAGSVSRERYNRWPLLNSLCTDRKENIASNGFPIADCISVAAIT
jgi:hypothetical protein